MAQKPHLKQTIINQVKAFERLLHREGLKVKAIYIFGSYVKGRAHKWSDIDLGVVSPSFSKDRLRERVRLMRLISTINPALEPHPFLPEDFDSPYYPLANEVKKTGIRVS